MEICTFLGPCGYLCWPSWDHFGSLGPSRTPKNESSNASRNENQQESYANLVSRSQSGASPGTPVRQSGKFFSPAGQPTNPIRRNFQSGGVSAPVRHRAKKTAPSTIQVTSASPADGPIRRLGSLGPWDPGTLGPWDPGTLGPWDPGTLGPWDPGTFGPGTHVGGGG